ncbi:hypothetical protein WME73_46535 [Sorangium sp. So ce302]|uniref:hypothetical protein n=1 Tax=Sorangium sp. So ce302 TaxID=3133297 RepID=UPI003F5E7269
MPDVLAKMIEDKAREVVAMEKRREEEAVREAARAQAEKAAGEERIADESRLARLRDRHDASLGTVPTMWYASRVVLVLFALLAALIGGCMFPACVEPMIGRSIMAASVFCPSVCQGCRGPGRVFTWHESGTWAEADVSVELCHNRAVDIDRLTWSDVSHREDQDLAPYRLTRWASVPVDVGLVLLVLLLAGPFVAAALRTRELERKRSAWEAEIDALERKLGLGGTRRPGDSPYR